MPILNQRHTKPLAYMAGTPDIVEKKLKNLRPTQSEGSDGLHLRLFL
jgi:hypothetical protein